MGKKRRIIAGVISLLGLALIFALAGSLAGHSQAQANVECEDIETTLTANFTGPLSTAGVVADGLLAGTTVFTGDNSAISAGMSGPTAPPATTLSYTGVLVFTTAEGTLTTRGVGIFDTAPTAMGEFSQFDRVIAGTGKFSGATGRLWFFGDSDFSALTTDSAVIGEICTVDVD